MRQDSIRIFQAGLAAVDPRKAIFRHCRRQGHQLIVGQKVFDLSVFSRVFVLGAGKAGAPMAMALEAILGDRISDGLVVVKSGHVMDLKTVKLLEAGHPVPDVSGLHGAEKIMALAGEASEDTLVICVLSGGASALLPLPAEGISLQDKQETTRVLLGCGAAIHEINTIRKHLSRIKGGQLAAAVYPATLISLVLSDVVGDNLDIIASGPTVPDPGTFKGCMDIVEKYGILDQIPGRVTAFLKKGVLGHLPETPKTGNPVFFKTCHTVVGCNREALNASSQKAEHLGYHSLILSDRMEGNVHDLACEHAGIVSQIRKGKIPLSLPACVLSGGEGTVTLKGKGKGGRNQEFALKFATLVDGTDNTVVLSAGTDGTDGPTDAAGALVDTATITRAKALGLDAKKYLENNDAYPLLAAVGDLYKTGPTLTNVMDIRVMLVG